MWVVGLRENPQQLRFVLIVTATFSFVLLTMTQITVRASALVIFCAVFICVMLNVFDYRIFNFFILW